VPESFTDDPLTGPRFEEALVYAARHHRRQLRKGGRIPYVAHLLAVAAIALEMETSEDEAIAAVLHDVIEDGGGMEAHAEITERFGADVARIVLANSDSVTGDADKAPWRERKLAYLASIAHEQPDELRVSLADKLHNTRSLVSDHRRLGDDLWSRFTTGNGDDVRWYHRELAVAFAARADDLGPGGRRALEELELAVAELG
jgi:GTP pyrophosphokinase